MKVSVIVLCCAIGLAMFTSSQALVLRRDCKQVCSTNVRCPFGYIKAANGCPTCRCKPFPMARPCNNFIRCPSYCIGGYDITGSGCAVCNCRYRQRVSLRAQ